MKNVWWRTINVWAMFGWDPISTVVQLYITLTVHAVLLLFHLLVLLTIFITILLTPGALCMTAPQRWDIIMYIFQIPAVVSFTFEQITDNVAVKAFHCTDDECIKCVLSIKGRGPPPTYTQCLHPS